MKLNIILSSAAVSVLSLLAVSCIDDSSTYGDGVLPTLSVNIPDNTDMPVYNFNYGDVCEITPEVNYTGSGELSYKWSLGTYDNNIKGKLEEISTEKTFSHFFEQGGSYYAQLEITDGVVGLAQQYIINVNRTFEMGYLVLSNTKDGKGNLAFIKDRTREEIESGAPAIITEHSLQKVNSNIGDDALVGATIIKMTWPATITRVMTATAKQGLYLDPNTFVVSSTINFDDVIPGFNATRMVMNFQNPVVVDPALKRFVTMNSENMFGYEDSGWKKYTFDLISSHTYMSGRNQTTDNYYVNYSPLEIKALVYDSVTWEQVWDSSSNLKDNDGNPMLQNHELVSIFRGEGIPGAYGMLSYPCCMITRDKTSGKIYSAGFSGLGSYSYGITSEFYGESEVDANTALPAANCVPFPSDYVHRTYYFNDNAVYMMLREGNAFIFPSKSQYSIQYPSTEEVTFITINTDPDNNTATEGEDLIVATADKNTGRGSIYIYDVRDVRTNNPNPEPKAVYRNCADRILQVIYKPRVAN